MADLNAQLQQVHALFQAGQLDEAKAQCAGVLRSAPNIPIVHQLYGLILRKKGDAQGAITAFEKALALQPGNHEIENSLGNALKDAGRRDAAKVHYQAALRAKKDYFPAAENLAILCDGEEDYAAVMAALAPFSGQPFRPGIEAIYVRALYHQKREDEAQKRLETALAHNPDSYALHYEKARIFLDQKNPEAALEEAKTFQTRSDEERLTAAILRGNALMTLNRVEDSAAAFLSALDIAPASPLAVSAAAKMLWMLGRGDEVDVVYERAIKHAPDNVEMRSDYARTLILMERDRDALDFLHESLDAVGPRPEFYHECATAMIKLRDPQQVVDYAQKAFDLAPDVLPVRANMVRGLLMSGKGEAALAHVMRGLERVPDDQLWIGLEVSALRLLGDPRYEYLTDYKNLVRPMRVPPPQGYETGAAFNDALFAHMKELHRYAQHPLDQSLRHGSQPTVDLLHSKDAVIRSYYEALGGPVMEYINAMPDDPDHPLFRRKKTGFRFTGSWSVRLNDGGYHVSHVHPEGWLSSAYYAEVPSNVAGSKDKQGWIKFGEPPFPIPGADAAEFWFEPKPGWLAVFPSYMWHGTNPIHGTEHRMTIPFDAVPD